MRLPPILSLLAILLLLGPGQPRAAAQRPEYLNDDEIEKVREAQEPNDRAKLFLKFASERLQRFQQALANPPQEESKRSAYRENLSYLLAAFTACLDDAADAVQIGYQHGAIVYKGASEMTKLGEGYMKTLEGLQQNRGPDFSAYEATLDDSIEATRDALAEAKKIVAEQAPKTGKEGRKRKP